MQLPDCEDPDVDIIDRVDEELLLLQIFAGHEHEQAQNCFVTTEQEVANNNQQQLMLQPLNVF